MNHEVVIDGVRYEPARVHEGNRPHRLKSNPAEAKFAAAWKDTNMKCDTLEFLMGDGNTRNYDVSDRDRLIAATVIQWLGSPVGGAWLNQVLGAL